MKTNYSQDLFSIKKRLNHVFLTSKENIMKVVLIWASFDVLSNKSSQKNLNLLTDEPLTKTNSYTTKTYNFPKNALNDYCQNLSLPIVGSAIDLLVFEKEISIQKNSLFTENNYELDKNGVTTPSNIFIKKSSQTLLVPTRSSCDFGRSISSLRAAGFLELVLKSKYSNQLLGAFVVCPQESTRLLCTEKSLTKEPGKQSCAKQANLISVKCNEPQETILQAVVPTDDIEFLYKKKSFLFISSCEIKQAFLLQQKYAKQLPKHIPTTELMEPEFIVSQFYGSLIQIEKSLDMNCNSLLKNLLFIINHRQEVGHH